MQNLTIELSSLEKTEYFALKMSEHLFQGAVILFWGDMGSGKTTFIKSLCSGLGVLPEKGDRSLSDDRGDLGTPQRTCPVIHQAECEGGLDVGAGAHRRSQLSQPTGEVPGRCLDQGVQTLLPA